MRRQNVLVASVSLSLCVSRLRSPTRVSDSSRDAGEVEVTSQGQGVDEARENLAEALALYFENEPDFEPRITGQQLDELLTVRPTGRARPIGLIW
jgi:hypothetical protein